MKSTRTHYIVMNYGGEIVYRGRNLERATERWIKGTVIGQGQSEDDARWDAEKQRGKLGKPEPTKAI